MATKRLYERWLASQFEYEIVFRFTIYVDCACKPHARNYGKLKFGLRYRSIFHASWYTQWVVVETDCYHQYPSANYDIPQFHVGHLRRKDLELPINIKRSTQDPVDQLHLRHHNNTVIHLQDPEMNQRTALHLRRTPPQVATIHRTSYPLRPLHRLTTSREYHSYLP